MKIDIIFVHFAVVAAVAIPYILFILAASRPRKLLKLRFHKEAIAMDLNVGQVDTWNSNIIGIDRIRQKVLFVQRRKGEIFVQLIDLKTIKNSILLHNTRTVKIRKKNEEILDKVELEVFMYSGETQTINFFDSDLTYYQDYEMRNAEKWHKIIQEAISFRPIIHSAA